VRDFIEENYEKIRGRVEKRVWDMQVEQTIDFGKTEMIEVDEFMSARSDWNED